MKILLTIIGLGITGVILGCMLLKGSHEDTQSGNGKGKPAPVSTHLRKFPAVFRRFRRDAET
jgi:hypothetical protein